MNNLVPFQKNASADKFQIQASFVQKSPFEIHLEFLLRGPISQMLCPPPEEPSRQDELWKSTCLEAFFGQKGSAYLEINCSPSGHWNAYEFESYRKGMRRAEHITVRLTRLEKDDQEARFFVQVISDKEFALSQVGLTMVFESTNHEKSYWALHHTGSVADFHIAETWTLPATR